MARRTVEVAWHDEWKNPPKVAATLNNDALACEMETLASTQAATNFSEGDVSAWATNVRGDGVRPRATAFCARVSVNHHIKRSCPSKRNSAAPEQFMFALWIVSMSLVQALSMHSESASLVSVLGGYGVRRVQPQCVDGIFPER